MARKLGAGESRKLVTVDKVAYARLKAYAKTRNVTLTAALNLAMVTLCERTDEPGAVAGE